MTTAMTRDEFLIWLENTFEIDDVIDLLVRHGICETDDIYMALQEYLGELQEVMLGVE